jgi:hypothetical protein
MIGLLLFLFLGWCMIIWTIQLVVAFDHVKQEQAKWSAIRKECDSYNAKRGST